MATYYFNRYQEVGEHCRGGVLTIGNFDGMHLGHQKLLQVVREHAALISAPRAVYTFNPHPSRVISPHKSSPMINGQRYKMKLLEALGIDVIINQEFTNEFSQISAHDFVVEILHKKLKLSEVVVGENYRFGREAQGDVNTLAMLLASCGMKLLVVPGVHIEGRLCSSTYIRELVQKGEMRTAAQFLGRPFSYVAQVEHGAGRGGSIGIPTVNVEAGVELIPANGVYASLVLINGRLFLGATNVGVRPTFEKSGVKTIETHLINENGDFYGKEIEIFFIDKIRDEKRFDSVAELKNQIKADIVVAQDIATKEKAKLLSWLSHIEISA